MAETAVLNTTELVFPTKVAFEKETLTGSYGRFVAEPLERGWGHTVGNSLRRILLSSLEGAAVTAVKIGGVRHEYSNIRGVKEDVLHVILNLKRLRLKIFSQGPETLYLEWDKAGPMKASAIRQTADVEILNKDLVIANLEAGTKVDFEIEVSRGRGYLSSDTNKREGRAAGYIATDAIFSPVVKVNYEVESARVGHITDYDRLTLDVWTDGSATPAEALLRSLKILSSLTDNFSLALSGEGTLKKDGVANDSDATPVHDVTEEIGKTKGNDYSRLLKDPKIQEFLKASIETLELTPRTLNCLKVAHIRVVHDLVRKTEDELMAYKNFGDKSLVEVKEKVKEMGLTLGMKI
ncbi:MAG: DNA-directed RNA polymerase subunit alpha [Elusimicrobiota bacterium]